jgi:hypothetical protein
MQMLVDRHYFPYYASVPWPVDPAQPQIDWINSIAVLEKWLIENVGQHYSHWAWHWAPTTDLASVAFRWQKDTTLFLLKWNL